MRAGDVVAALAAFEDELPVHSWRVGALHVWPIVRLQLGFSLLASGEAWQGPPALPRVYLREARALLDAWRAAAREPHGMLRRVDTADVVFLTSPIYRQDLGTTSFDKYFEPLGRVAAERGVTTLTLEHGPAGGAAKLPRRSPAWLIRPRLVIPHARAALSPLPSSELVLPDHETLRRRVSDLAPGVRLASVATLRRQVLAIEHTARWFDGLLARVQPRAVFMACYYNLVGMALCLTAARRGITSVDVQHGVMHGNPAHDGWRALPERGYELLPRVFWCWSEHDAAVVHNWTGGATSAHRAVVGGHPFLTYWEHADGSTVATSDAARALRGLGPNVLVSLSWSHGWTELLERTLRAAPPDFTFWVRLHPSMAQARARILRACRTLGAARVHVEAPTDLPLPALLRHADVHLTHSSSVVQEAAMLGVASVVIDARAQTQYGPLIESGWARHADTPEAILAALRAQIARPTQLPAHHQTPDRATLARVFASLAGAPATPPERPA